MRAHHRMSKGSIWSALALALASALTMSGCSVVSSGTIEPSGYAPAAHRTCQSSLGSYTLPKTKLLMTIKQNEETGVNVLTSITPVKVGDDPQRYTFCLDFLESAFADDRIQVIRTTPAGVVDGKDDTGGLLKIVASHSIDMTGVVLQKVIRAIFIYLSGDAGFISGRAGGRKDPGDGTWRDVLKPSFDPFDAVELAQWNKSMRRYGFCVAIGEYSFDAAVSYKAYCDDPVRINRDRPSTKQEAVDALRKQAVRDIAGLYYRPRAAYPVTIFVNPDPEGHGEWRVGQTVHIEMENISPVLALRIDRAMFAIKKTAVVFDVGRLRDVCLVMGSEIYGAITPVLEFAYSLIQLPSAVISAEISAITQSKLVYEAEKKVIDMQGKLIELRLAQLERQRTSIDRLAKAVPTPDSGGGLLMPATSDSDFENNGTPPNDLDEPAIEEQTRTGLDGICNDIRDKKVFSAFLPTNVLADN
jgi:hypothetical protein